jgi:hypothetical protein
MEAPPLLTDVIRPWKVAEEAASVAIDAQSPTATPEKGVPEAAVKILVTVLQPPFVLSTVGVSVFVEPAFLLLPPERM